MRMASWRLILLVLLRTVLNNACASTISLSPELTNFVPACAQECFVSFLESNFPTKTCSTAPSLGCLCSYNTTSGYTIGEGAVQCIISEDNIGFCKGTDAAEAVVLDAYSMCNGQTDALPNTHGTITATLIVQTSTPSVVLIAPNPTSTGPSGADTSATSGTVASAVPSNTKSSSAASPTSSHSAQAASDTAALSPALSKSQIVAITVASVGGTAVAFGMLLLFACLRRRKRAARDSDMLPFQLDPSNGIKYSFDYKATVGRKILKPGGTVNGVAARVTPQIPPRLETSTPNMFSRRSIIPDTIGLAISPGTPTPVEKIRLPSTLLPEKPVLTLETTQEDVKKPLGGPRYTQPGQQMAATSRQSTATQFEEDDESAVTSAKEEKGYRWVQPSTKSQEAFPGDWRPNKPTVIAVPPPAVTRGPGASAWRSGNASKANAAAIVPEPIIKPLSVARSANSFSQPRRTEEHYRSGPKLQLQVPARPTTTASSVYSQQGSSVQSSENGRISGPPRSRRSYKQAGPYDIRASGGSLTSFETNDSLMSPQDPEPRTAGTDLSPVVESPSGTSPVSYPRIPKRLSDGAMRMMPPPPQPKFELTSNIPRWKQAELSAQRQRMGLAPFQANPNATSDAVTTGQFPQPPTHQRQRSREYIAPSAAYNLLPSQTPNQFLPQPARTARGNLTSTNLPPGLSISFSRTSSNISLTSKTSTSTSATGSSSLLAKRRGEQKAQALIGSLQDVRINNDEERKKGKSGWRVLKAEDKDKAKSPLWRPMLATGEQGVGGDGGKGRNPVGREREERTFFEQTELPRTPGWIPKLTPTRRGDELFLSVQ